jgi:PAS domain S-box-containing protein
VTTASPGSELRRLRALVGDLDAVVWEADAASGRFTFVSQRAWDMLGYAPKMWIDSPSFWADHLHPDDRERALEGFMAGISQGRPHDMEYRFLHRDGSIVWLRDIGHAVRDNQGNPVVLRGLMVEITQHKLAEERRAEAEQRYRRLVEQLPGMVYMESVEREGDEPGHLIYVSPQVESMLGYRVEEWLADPTLWSSRLHPDDVPRLKAVYRRVTERGDPYRADYRMFARDGSLVFIHDEAALVREQDGTPVFWQGVMFDVTQQRLADERAQESEARYQGLVESLPAIVYTESFEQDQGGIVYVSPQVRAILGREPEDWLGATERWLEQIHPDDRDRVRAENARADTSHEAFISEYRMLARDGRSVWFRDESALVRDEDGNPLYWQGVMLDITERVRAEELERALEVEREGVAELRALDEMKNTFLQAVSHDLRTPLAAILGLAVTLEREDVEIHPNETKDLASRIATNARKLDRMVNDLLDLDRLTRGIVEPNLEPVDVGEMIYRLVRESDLVVDRQVQITIEPVTAVVDPPKVERIVENLLVNAVRHTPSEAKIWISVTEWQGGVLLAVEDEGKGVPAEERERIFEPFRQGADAPEHSPGVGIGLALVARFAALLGGRAWVEDRVGGGASFRVWLPCKPATPPPDPRAGIGG